VPLHHMVDWFLTEEAMVWIVSDADQ